MFRYHSMRLAGVVFQACSFNHSDISPFKINDLRAAWNSVAQNLLHAYPIRLVTWFQSLLTHAAPHAPIVSDPQSRV